MTSLKKLRELAMAATPGPWKYEPREGVIHDSLEYLVETTHNHGSRSWAKYIAKADHGFCFDIESDNERNMQFIAALNPQTILKILDEVEAARAMRDLLVPGRDDVSIQPYDQIRKQNEGDL